jgi:hypothetical protein
MRRIVFVSLCIYLITEICSSASLRKTPGLDQLVYSGAQICRIDNSTNAFLWTPNLSTAAYAGNDAGRTPFKVVVIDEASKTATAYFGGQGSGEILGPEIFKDNDFEDFFNWLDVKGGNTPRNQTIIHSGVQSAGTWSYPRDASYHGQPDLSLVDFSVYKYTIWLRSTFPTGKLTMQVYGKETSQGQDFTSGTMISKSPLYANTGTWVQETFYFGADSYKYRGVGFFIEITGTPVQVNADSASLKRVLDGPAMYSLHCLTTLNGTIRGWTNDAGFNYNAKAYTIQISKAL